MKLINRIVVLPLVFAATATIVVAQSKKPSAPTRIAKEDDQQIRNTMMNYEQAWNTHDMKALNELFRDDAEFINVVGMHWRGRDAIVKAHAVFHEIMFKDCRLKTDTIEIRPLGGEHAIAVVTYTQDSFKTPSGQVMPKTQTKLSYVLARTSGNWKIVHGENVRVDAEAAQNDPVNSPRK